MSEAIVKDNVMDSVTDQIMVFTVGEKLFAVNLDEVLEIMRSTEVTPLQKSHPIVEGVFKLRDQVVTIIDTAMYFDLMRMDLERDVFICTMYDERSFAFHVDSVEGMERVDREAIKEPDQVIYGGEGVVTGIVELDGRLITIINFRKILESLGA